MSCCFWLSLLVMFGVVAECMLLLPSYSLISKIKPGGINILKNASLCTRKQALMTAMGYAYMSSAPPKTRVLIIGFGAVARSVVRELRRKKDQSYWITSTTTKPRRTRELQSLVDEVVVIPQLAVGEDEVLKASIRASDVVLIADAVKMFSVHSFARTALRVRKLSDELRWKGMVAMVSSENAYGSVLGGAMLTESSPVFPNVRSSVSEPKTLWHVNPSAMANVIRLAENAVLGMPRSALVLRTAGIWDSNKFNNAVLYTNGKKFPSVVGDSGFSFCTSKTIGKCLAWGIQREQSGVFNLAERGCIGLTRRIFYEQVHYLYGSVYANGPMWDQDAFLDLDTLFCTDPDPFLPTSQRSNSHLVCTKIMESGFFY